MNATTHILIRMSKDLGLLPDDLQRVIRTSPLRYKQFSIRKKNGELRQLAQPAREVKAIQRWLINEISRILPVHAAATAYQPGSSINHNARLHVNSNYFLKLDFKDFFPSILAKDIEAHIREFSPDRYKSDEMALIARACTWAKDRQPPLRLCIGAPSSPFLANTLMYAFDVALHEKSLSEGVVYSRYADDITLSCTEKGVLSNYLGFVESLLISLPYPRLRLNTDKTFHGSKTGRRIVTGLVLTPAGEVSVGRDRKRLVRAMYYHWVQGRLRPEQVVAMNGLLAFIESIEPGFSERLCASVGGPTRT